ncbi:acyl-CoA N-acyltransferase [Neohortaea acidophila]|uniref:Acyl-CoA N-acyltransferase n=1 Tax=Neohortaea acidophila TaxID=245834 RepID=A0A6A6PI59_9PEZI|nr:acyl-CoA N-acyltransferase [Neohortaea acidophila]KAF2479411.1 acyl-CoA N-acyltransferase [Neohortaea acidophila]
MPQASILAWLSNKSTSVPEATCTKAESAHSNFTSAQPTRPLSSQQDSSHTNIFSATTATTSTPSQPFIGSARPLPANVELRTCTKTDIPHLKRLNSLLLPLPYPDSFYREITEDPTTSNLTLLAFWHDDPAKISTPEETKGRLVGAISCRILPRPSAPLFPNTPSTEVEKRMLYLSTLVVLSPFRQHGIATRMLDIVTRRAISAYGVASIGAHVWEANAEAREWYAKRGFVELRREEGYYRRLEPRGAAVVVERRVSVMDLVGD